MSTFALAFLHLITGLFFITTGYRKIVHYDVHQKFLSMMGRHGVPRSLGIVVMTAELLGGVGLFFGVFTRLAAAGLLFILLNAYRMDTWPEVKAKQMPLAPDYSKLLSNALCTPEFQLIVILFTIALLGGGPFVLVPTL